MITTFKPIAGPLPRTPAWFSMRKFEPNRQGRPVVIGASDSAPACGMSEYRTPLDVFAEALGVGIPFEGNQGTRMGQWQEEGILREWEFTTGKRLYREQPMYFHPEISFLAATPDALVVENEIFKLAVDAKDTTGRMLDSTGEDGGKFGHEGTDAVPIDYYFQGQQQIAVLGVEAVEFAAWFADQKKLRIYRVERDDAVISCIIDAEKELVERIINRDPPEPDWSHERTRKLIQQVNGLEMGKKKVLSPEAAEKWVQRQAIKDAIKAYEDQLEALTNEVLFEMADAQIGLLSNGTKQIKRTVIAPQIVSQADVDKLAAMVGQVKKKGHERMTESKVK